MKMMRHAFDVKWARDVRFMRFMTFVNGETWL